MVIDFIEFLFWCFYFIKWLFNLFQLFFKLSVTFYLYFLLQVIVLCNHLWENLLLKLNVLIILFIFISHLFLIIFSLINLKLNKLFAFTIILIHLKINRFPFLIVISMISVQFRWIHISIILFKINIPI